LGQQYVSIAYRSPGSEAAVGWGQLVRTVLLKPWFPVALKNGVEAPNFGQNCGPKIVLTFEPVWSRSP
jgi:hypothetical protein